MSEVVKAPSWVNLFTGVTSANSAPSAATDGVRIPNNQSGKVVVIRLRHTTTAGNDARTCAVKLWWYCLGEIYDAEHATLAGTAVGAASVGWDDLGESYSLASVSADGNVTAFVLESPTVYSRLYCELTAVTGTGTAVGVAAAFTDENSD